MSTIRQQSIFSSIIIYFGFALGFFNTYLFARGFSVPQYGLTGTFVAFAISMFSFAQLGMTSYINKFFPYYKDNLSIKKNDMITVALVTSITGFMLMMLVSYLFKDFVIQKYGTNSPELVTYYNWLFPFGFGLTIFSVLEAYAWQFRKSILSNLLREVVFRMLTTILILLYYFDIIPTFDLFIKIYSLTYIVIAAILLGYLALTGKLYINFSLSRVTKKFYKKILTLCAFVWSGGLVFNIAQVFDTLVIAAVIPDGLKFVGIYTLAQNIASLVQAPQRAVIAAAVGPLSQAWKNKNYEKLNHIYHRSSINQLIFAVGMFTLIWINFTDGVVTFKLKDEYLQAQYIFLYIGLMRVVDLGTGLNSQVISTSTFWRFEFITGVILLAITLPLNYLLAIKLGVIGPAISNLIALSIYNAIRYSFLLRKFKMQPFTPKTIYTLILGAACFFVCHILFHNQLGFGWIVLRSSVFVALYLGGILLLDLSPDVLPVWRSFKKRLGMKG